MITGTTRLVAIVGQPIAQVKSPENFNSWFAATGRDTAMMALDLAPDALRSFVDTARGLHNLDGFVVTIPYKQSIVPLLDAVSARSRALRSVNVVRRHADGRLEGDIVDGLGFLAAAASHGFAPSGRRALVVGAGGVGSAIAHALCEEGLAGLALIDAAPGRADALSSHLAAAFGVRCLAEPESLAAFDLVVNATPAGMAGHASLPLPAELLDTLAPAALVADVVTAPAETPLLAYARLRGCRIQSGPEMASAQRELLAGHLGLANGA